MSDQILYQQDNVEDLAVRLEKLSSQMSSVVGSLRGVNTSSAAGGSRMLPLSISFSGLGASRANGSNVREDLRSISAAASASADYMQRLSRAVRQVSAEFMNADQRVSSTPGNDDGGTSVRAEAGSMPERKEASIWLSLFEIVKEIIHRLKVMDPFDGFGQNGGNQSNAAENTAQYDDFRRIIEKNTGIRYDNDKELKKWLQTMANVGCSYVAMTNAIFQAYVGREEEFEKTFGFPLYGPDGDFNYDCLLVDFYSSTGMNRGMFVSEQAESIAKYCESHGIEADITVHSNQRLTAKEYRRMLANGEVENGQLAISVGCPFSLKTMDGEEYSTWKSSAHTMTVIGTQGDYLVVSSWGKTYLLDPSDNNNWNAREAPSDYGYLIVRVK